MVIPLCVVGVAVDDVEEGFDDELDAPWMVEVSGIVDTSGVVEVSGSVDTSGVVEVSGSVDFSGVVEVSGSVEFSGVVEVSGSVDFSGVVVFRLPFLIYSSSSNEDAKHTHPTCKQNLSSILWRYHTF